MINEKTDVCVCYIIILIFKFIFIYLLHVLFVLKINGIFGRKKFNLKMMKRVIFFIYIV